MNPKLLALAPTIGVLTTTILFNKSSYALPMYTWLNANFTPFQINTYVGFALTSGVYWAGGLIYMALDLWEPLRSRVESYKLQPGSRVTGADYRKVCLIVLRNQVSLYIQFFLLCCFILSLFFSSAFEIREFKKRNC